MLNGRAAEYNQASRPIITQVSRMTLPHQDQIILGDCTQVMNSLPEKCIDLIFADPPYNLQLNQALWRPNMTKVDAVNDEWDKFESFEAYDTFTRNWLSACKRVLKDNGTLWVIGSYHNIYRVGSILMDLGYWILNDIVWIKSNPMPNFRGVRFTNAHETLLWVKKSEKSRYTFNYHAMKSMNGGKQMRSDWEIPICSGSERIRVNGQKAHSTQKPEALLERVILSSSNPGDIVLDPFSGSGTTAAVAKRLHRHWIGIDQDEVYVNVARKRVDRVQPERRLDFNIEKQRSTRKVSFKKLVENGAVQKGQTLYFKKNQSLAATVQPNGSIRHDGCEGSIHQVGRFLQNGISCNGWQHWYYLDQENNLQPIDTIRQRFLSGEATSVNFQLANG
jgi:modification methylase